jgi:hypothetical protein
MNTEMTIRSEAAERAALADLYRAAPPALRETLGLELRAVDGALVSVAAGRPSIVVNRTVGLGVAHSAERETVAAIVEHYRSAGVERCFVHLDPAAAPPELPGWLAEHGLEPYHRAWAKFTRGPSPAPAPRSDLEVRRIGPELADDFGRIAASGFELHPDWIEAVAGLVGRPGWHCYLSFDGDRPAGCGAMRVQDGVAWCDWAATLPEFRRRGSQGAILARRINDGVRLGVERFATCTGEAVAGDPQHSYRNIERFGFRRTHARANWVPVRP